LQLLSGDELAVLEVEALKRASAVLADGYYRSKPAGGPAHEVYRRMILESEVTRILNAEALKKAS
jgi:hypothetical protein